MTYRIAYVLIGLLLSFCVSATNAPSFELTGPAGPVSLQNYKGKVVFLDFWASWCPPCRKSFPWMNTLEKKYGRYGFTVVAINVDKHQTMAEKFLSRTPAAFAIGYDPNGHVAQAYGLKVMPSSFLIDRNGNLVVEHKGFRDKDKKRLEDRIRKLLARE